MALCSWSGTETAGPGAESGVNGEPLGFVGERRGLALLFTREIANTNRILETGELCMSGFGYSESEI